VYYYNGAQWYEQFLQVTMSHRFSGWQPLWSSFTSGFGLGE